jgi:hypothetical protein
MVGTCSEVLMELKNSEGLVEKQDTFVFRLVREKIHLSQISKVNDFLDRSRIQLDVRLSQFEETQGSGWTMAYFLTTFIEIVKAPKLFSGRGGKPKNMEMDAYLRKTFQGNSYRGLSDIEAPENECFYYACAQYFVRKKNGLTSWDQKTNASEVKEFIEENFKGHCKKSKKISQVRGFERENSHLNVGINILYYDPSEKSLFPLLPTEHTDVENVIDLLLLDVTIDEKTGKRESHYILIRDLRKLFRRQYNSRSHAKSEICRHCFYVFSGAIALKNHQERCGKNPPQKVITPAKGETMKFKGYNKQFLASIFGVGDFESKMIPTNKSRGPGSDFREEQVPVSYSLLFMDKLGEVIFERTESSETECMHLFFTALEEAWHQIALRVNAIIPMEIGEREKEELKEKASRCHICRQRFLSPNEEKEAREKDRARKKKEVKEGEEGEEGEDRKAKLEKVLDHDHYTGTILGVAHNVCNMSRRRQVSEIPVYFHNLAGYDSHLLMQGIAEMAKEGRSVKEMKLSGLVYNTEKLRTLHYKQFHFLDSLAFLNAPLNQVVEDLVGADHSFPLLTAIVENENQLQLIKQKGYFPYQYLTNLAEFEKLTEIPAIEFFYSDLSGCTITEAAHEHAKNVFSAFHMTNMREYLELYNRVDVLLLTEAIVCFRAEVYSKFELDMCQYISLSQMAFDCYLKYTGTEIELMSNIDMITKVEQAIRGGNSFVRERYVKTTEEQQLLYVDANNLYGFCECLPLPIGEYVELRERDFSRINWLKQSLDQTYGYMACVDLEYPAELHDSHSAFPLAVDNLTVTYEDLSPYAKMSLDACSNRSKSYKAKKLIGSFLPKKITCVTT